MIAIINSTGLSGIDGYIVNCEVDISNGLPSFDIVGLPDVSVKESKERIRSAIKNNDLVIPAKKITVNLAPANIKKEGAYLDLPISLGLLVSSGQLIIPNCDEYVFLGELSLDGSLRHINGVLPMIISAYQNGIRKAFVPLENAEEAAVIEGMEVYGVKNLPEICMHFTGQKTLKPTIVDIKNIFESSVLDFLDFADVKGQQHVKRALEITAAGGHNALLIGPPGSGKTMLAQRLPSILPTLSFDEALEVTKIHSISGNLPKNSPIITSRPFRSPHHTISSVGLSGGGSHPRPGEISLAHNGVLFLDELPEFKRDALEIMRQPLEDGKITISRASATVSYPCNITLIASMNPCPCGFYGDRTRECTCTQSQINKYISKISGPLLDRIDIHIEVPAVKYDELESKVKSESSAEIKNRVDNARQIQLDRYAKSNIYSNSQLTPELISIYCRLDDNCNKLLKQAFETLGLSARAHNRILKVARTIADLSGKENIEVAHIAEAIQYRALDRNFFS